MKNYIEFEIIDFYYYNNNLLIKNYIYIIIFAIRYFRVPFFSRHCGFGNEVANWQI